MEETWYYTQVAKIKHPEVQDEWVRRAVEGPDRSESRTVNGERRRLLYKFIEEIDRWVLVILTEDGRLLNRHIDRQAMRRWGRP